MPILNSIFPQTWNIYGGVYFVRYVDPQAWRKVIRISRSGFFPKHLYPWGVLSTIRSQASYLFRNIRRPFAKCIHRCTRKCNFAFHHKMTNKQKIHKMAKIKWEKVAMDLRPFLRSKTMELLNLQQSVICRLWHFVGLSNFVLKVTF